MAQQTVTFEQVAQAAGRLQDEGRAVGIETVSEVLGAGSASSIHQHLSAWRASQARPAETAKAEIPEALAAELGRWAQQFAEASNAGPRDALAAAEGDMAAMLAEVDSLTAERDDALAIAEERNETIARLTAALNDARQVATNALVGKAKDQLAIDGKDAQLVDLRAQIERNVASAATLSDARLTAEMELVGAVTARDNFEAEIKELRAQLAARAR